MDGDVRGDGRHQAKPALVMNQHPLPSGQSLHFFPPPIFPYMRRSTEVTTAKDRGRLFGTTLQG